MISEEPVLCINTQSGRCTRYVRTALPGIRVREAGAVDLLNYHPERPIAYETIDALDRYRKEGCL